MFRLRRLAVVAGLACALGPATAAAAVLTVSAATSLGDALRDIGARFEATHPGIGVRLNIAASGVLVQQIVQGAPADVLVSADQESVDRGVRLGVVDPATRRDIARNTLVMVVPARGAAAVSRPADLLRPEVRRIAVGKPATVPVGRYTRQALESAQLWTAVAPKVVFGDNARQVLDYVARGEVEAGFVFRTDADRLRGRVRTVATMDGHAPIAYPAAVVLTSRHRPQATAFVEFLASGEARAILARHGFGTP